MDSTTFYRLLHYPQNNWDYPAFDKWDSLCVGLRDYQAPPKTLVIGRERRFELSSSFQKSVRRGDKDIALRLVSAMDGMPEQWSYFWRRLCVIACEDVGPANDVLASFVVACATVFHPKETGEKNYDLFCYLAERMCDVPVRSRVYCSCAIIEHATMDSELPELTAADKAIISAITERRLTVQAMASPWEAWQKKNNWRADGLLKFVGLRLPLEMMTVQTPVPPHKMLFDLPSYCYDQYTRVGRVVLQRLVRGVSAEEIREFFQRNKLRAPHLVLGEALFFVEGGRIKNEVVYEPLACLEQRLFAHQFGLSLDAWVHLREMTCKALECGIVDRVREEVLRRFHAQMSLGLT